MEKLHKFKFLFVCNIRFEYSPQVNLLITFLLLPKGLQNVIERKWKGLGCLMMAMATTDKRLLQRVVIWLDYKIILRKISYSRGAIKLWTWWTANSLGLLMGLQLSQSGKIFYKWKTEILKMNWMDGLVERQNTSKNDGREDVNFHNYCNYIQQPII